MDAFFTGLVTKQGMLRILEKLLKSRALKSLLLPQQLNHRFQRQLESHLRLPPGEKA